MELFALLDFRQIWLMIPLVIAYALVHAGTRHEQLGPIFRHAARFAGSLFIFLVVIYLLLLLTV